MMQPDPSVPTPPIGRLAHWRLTEPVRFYVYGWALAVLLCAAGAGVSVGAWTYPATVALTVLVLVPAVEAARASVYSPRGAMAERVDAALRARLNR